MHGRVHGVRLSRVLNLWAVMSHPGGLSDTVEELCELVDLCHRRPRDSENPRKKPSSNITESFFLSTSPSLYKKRTLSD